MLLYQNSLILLDYDPSTDVLSVEWPNVEPYLLPEIRRTLEVLVESIRNYDVKKLLIDASQTTISPELYNSPDYKDIVTNFAFNLTKTRLKKSARVYTQDKEREAKATEMAAEVVKDTGLTIQTQNFASKAEALQWLIN